MKNKLLTIVLICLVAAPSCSKRNDIPTCLLTGALLYNSENVFMDGAPNTSPLLIKHHGYLIGDESLYVDASGTFRQMLSPGYYTISIKEGRYPFIFEDFMNGAQGEGSHIGITVSDYSDSGISIGVHKDLNIVPFFLLSKFFAWYDSGMSAIRLMCTIKANTDSRLKTKPTQVKAIHVYLSPTSIVNSKTACEYVWDEPVTELVGPVFISVPLSLYKSIYGPRNEETIYCRMALEIEDAPDYYLFTNTIKINQIPNN